MLGAKGSDSEMNPNNTQLLLALLVGHLQTGIHPVSDTPKGTSVHPLGTFALLKESGENRDGMGWRRRRRC